MSDFAEKPPEQSIGEMLRRIEGNQEVVMKALGIVIAKLEGAPVNASVEFLERLGLKVSRVAQPGMVIGS